jgi:hypothetical protein
MSSKVLYIYDNDSAVMIDDDGMLWCTNKHWKYQKKPRNERMCVHTVDASQVFADDINRVKQYGLEAL